jgi:hypothetical protein
MGDWSDEDLLAMQDYTGATGMSWEEGVQWLLYKKRKAAAIRELQDHELDLVVGGREKIQEGVL